MYFLFCWRKFLKGHKHFISVSCWTKYKVNIPPESVLKLVLSKFASLTSSVDGLSSSKSACVLNVEEQLQHQFIFSFSTAHGAQRSLNREYHAAECCRVFRTTFRERAAVQGFLRDDITLTSMWWTWRNARDISHFKLEAGNKCCLRAVFK